MEPEPGDTARHAASYSSVIIEQAVQSYVYPENEEPPLRAGQQRNPPSRSHLHWEHSAEVPRARQPAVSVNNGGATPAAPDPAANRRGGVRSHDFRFLSGQEVRRKAEDTILGKVQWLREEEQQLR